MIDGHKVSTNIRTSKELLLMLKDLSRTFRWKTRYNPTEEIVHIITQDMPDLTTLPIPVTEPTSRRLDGKIICLDAGHGGADGGSRGPNGTWEKDHTLAITHQLCTLLEENGASVIMTRTTDESPSAKNEQRITIANDADADLFLSIHADGFYPRPHSAVTVYYYQRESRPAAESLADALANTLSDTASAVTYGTFPILRYASMTALRIDVASLADPEEEVLLASQDGRLKIASALYLGITQYFHV